MNKEYIKWLSQPSQMDYISNSANAAEREKRKAELKNRFEKSNFAEFSNSSSGDDNGSWVQAMGAAVEDVGNEEFSFMNDAEFNFAAFNQSAKQETAFQSLRRIVAVSNVRESAKQWALQKNEIRRRNKAKQKEKEKAEHNPNVSKPFWY
jgi:hypothetical protein